MDMGLSDAITSLCLENRTQWRIRKGTLARARRAGDCTPAPVTALWAPSYRYYEVKTEEAPGPGWHRAQRWGRTAEPQAQHCVGASSILSPLAPRQQTGGPERSH